MGRKYQQLTIYPEPTARRIVGGNSPACNRAIACWARMLQQSMPELSREEWNFLADVLNGSYDDALLGLIDGGPAALAMEVHDAQALNGTGDRWFGDELERGSGQAAADALREKILKMEWHQVQYIHTATGFFWSELGTAKIDHQRDEWWTVPFRCRALDEAEDKD